MNIIVICSKTRIRVNIVYNNRIISVQYLKYNIESIISSCEQLIKILDSCIKTYPDIDAITICGNRDVLYLNPYFESVRDIRILNKCEDVANERRVCKNRGGNDTCILPLCYYLYQKHKNTRWNNISYICYYVEILNQMLCQAGGVSECKYKSNNYPNICYSFIEEYEMKCVLPNFSSEFKSIFNDINVNMTYVDDFLYRLGSNGLTRCILPSRLNCEMYIVTNKSSFSNIRYYNPICLGSNTYSFQYKTSEYLKRFYKINLYALDSIFQEIDNIASLPVWFSDGRFYTATPNPIEFDDISISIMVVAYVLRCVYEIYMCTLDIYIPVSDVLIYNRFSKYINIIQLISDTVNKVCLTPVYSDLSTAVTNMIMSGDEQLRRVSPRLNCHRILKGYFDRFNPQKMYVVSADIPLEMVIRRFNLCVEKHLKK